MKGTRRAFDEADFEALSFHDSMIRGLAIRTPEPERNDFTSELVLDLEYVVEWLCRPDGGGSLRMAPATLTFRDVTDLVVSVDWRRDDVRQSLHPMSIHRLVREPLVLEHAPDYACWRWRLELNWPEGALTFGATGFRLEVEPREAAS